MADEPVRILSLGYDRRLMFSRSLVLRSHGYAVVEVYRVDEAIRTLKSSSTDVVLMCHTLPADDQRAVIAAAHAISPGLPIVCVSAVSYRVPSEHCIVVDTDPWSVIAGLQSAVRRPPPTSDFRDA